MDFHSQSIRQVYKTLETNQDGLSLKEAQKRLRKYGRNTIPRERPLSAFMIFVSQFNSPLIYILLFSGIASLFLRAYVDAVVIFFAIFANVLIGFFQEYKANKAIVKLRNMVEQKAIVLREGREMLIDASLLTVGDIILLKSGNHVPADARIIEAINLQVNEAMLTGESLPSYKKTESIPRGATLADRENMLYAGTTILSGLGRAVVVAVGKKTEIGKIATVVRDTKEEKTPLQLRLAKFGKQLGLLFVFITFLVILIGILQGRNLFTMLETGVALGVAAIPEGLSMAVVFILAFGMQKILRQKALTRKLLAAETLGSITVICTDKTGTLTEGKMHVDHIVIGENEFEINSLGSRQNKLEAKTVSMALQAGMMCNDAIIENPEDALATWRIIGSPTEKALLSAAIQSGLKKEKLLKIEPKVAELPFDSKTKYMISLHKKNNNSYILYEKGAPERLLEKSIAFYSHNGIKMISAKDRRKLNDTYEKMTAKGLRVIGVAKREFRKKNIDFDSLDWDKLDKDLIFIGFIAIRDPLRKDAADTIKICKRAGIKPVLITGDHYLTARAIARELGLNAGKNDIMLGEDLDKISDEDLKKIVKKIDVYARVNPHHKLRIVKILQESGEVVAMTGDGINDSPALKVADVGISLGTGTDIAKETSDIVLLDDNFKTIVSAIREGRVIFANIKKVITFLMSDSFSEMILVVGSIVFGVPLAILPAQILWINIINDTFPHFSLAFEKGDSSIMQKPPIKKESPLLDKKMKIIIFGVGIIRDVFIFFLFYFLYLLLGGKSLPYLNSLMFLILGIKSLFSIFSIRSLDKMIWKTNPFSNKYLLLAVSLSLFFLLIGIYAPFLQKMLSTISLGFIDWFIAVLVAFWGLMLTEFVKLKWRNR